MMFHLHHALRMAEDLHCAVQRRCLSLTACCVLTVMLVTSWGKHCPNLFEQLVGKGEWYLCTPPRACCSILFLIKSEKEEASFYFLNLHEVRPTSSLSLSPEQLKTMELLYLRFFCILTYWCN